MSNNNNKIKADENALLFGSMTEEEKEIFVEGLQLRQREKRKKRCRERKRAGRERLLQKHWRTNKLS